MDEFGLGCTIKNKMKRERVLRLTPYGSNEILFTLNGKVGKSTKIPAFSFEELGDFEFLNYKAENDYSVNQNDMITYFSKQGILRSVSYPLEGVWYHYQTKERVFFESRQIKAEEPLIKVVSRLHEVYSNVIIKDTKKYGNHLELVSLVGLEYNQGKRLEELSRKYWKVD